MPTAPPPLAVSAWGGTAALPSLDPASLYAIALVQLADVPEAHTAAPSSWFHTDAVPSLYTIQSGGAGDEKAPQQVADTLASTPVEIRTYLREHTSLDRELLRDAQSAAQAQAIHALLDDVLSDLVLHTMFSLPPNFQKVTCPAIVRTRSRWPSSLPRRLRAAVQARLESPHIRLWGAGGSWEREEMLEAQRWNMSAGLPQARDPVSHLPRTGFAANPSLASDVREQWERSRLASRARGVCHAVCVYLDQDYIAHTSTPSSVDARLYSLLAPLLYATWPIDVLPALLREEFPSLVAHTERMHALLWGKEQRTWAFRSDVDIQPPAWTWPTWSSLRESLTPSWLTRSTPSSEATDAKPLAPTLRYGRWLWLATALIGPIVYVLASGLVVIEYEDMDEDDDEEIDDEEIEEEEIKEEEDIDDDEEMADIAEELGTVDPEEFLDDEE